MTHPSSPDTNGATATEIQSTQTDGIVRNKPGAWLLRIMLIAVAYAGAAAAGHLLPSSSVYTSPLWPAAGLALAALLMCGLRCWAGIWLGALVFDLWLNGSAVGTVMAPLLAGGATLQAMVGALLARRFLTAAQPLSAERDVWRFLLLAGPVACVTSATIGVAVLAGFGHLAVADMGTQWLLWWTGDSLGVVLFAPVVLWRWSGGNTLWPRAGSRVVVPLLVTALLVAAGYWGVTRLEQSRAKDRADQVMEDVYDSYFPSLSAIIAPLHSVERFFAASNTVTRAQYATFTALVVRQPGMIGIDWAPRVAGAARAAFTAAQRRQGVHGYHIFQLDARGRPLAEGRRAEYFPVRYTAPLATNRVVLGLDHGFEAARRVAMARARDSGRIVSAAVVPLIRTGRQAFLAFNPVYHRGFAAAAASVTARRRALRGYVVGVFDVQKLFMPLARAAAAHHLEFRVQDVTPGDPVHLLEGGLSGRGAAGWQREVKFTDRVWRLEMRPEGGYWHAGTGLQSRIYFGFSVLAAFLIAYAVLSAAGRQRATEAVVATRTGELEQQLEARRAAEAALRESEGDLNITLRSIGDAVLATDAAGRVTRMNPVAEHLTGWSLSAALGRPIEEVFQILNEETRLPATIPVADVLRTGRIHGLANHTVLIARDGSEYFIADSAAPIRGDDGVLRGVVLVFRDVGTEREAERSLQASEARYRRLIESAPLGVFVESDGNFAFLNSTAVGLLGAGSAAELLGRPVLDFIAADSHASVRERMHRLKAEGKAVPPMEENWLRIDGSPFDGEAAAVPYEHQGQPGALVFLQDITARRELEAQLERFFSLSLDMLCISSGDGYFKRLSPAFTRTLGWSLDEMLSRPYIDFVHPDDLDATLQEVERQVKRGEPVLQFENRYRHRDGSWRILSWRSMPQPNGLMFATARDVTGQRAAAQQLEQARADAEQANRAKSAFLATMSHEIRTPMNGVIGMVEVLAQSRLSQHQSELVNTIRESAMALLNIIDDILDFSKIEAGRLEIEHQPISVVDIVEGLCNSLVPVAAAKGVEITLFVSPEIPERVLSDDVRLRQVLYNLVGNAIKFSGGRPGQLGEVTVRVEVIEPEPLRLRFRIADNGIGMEPSTLDELFTPFTQAEISTTRRFGGTGLGLAICKRLVELMEGEVTVTSTFGRGTEFTVELPFAIAAEQPPRTRPDLSAVSCIVVADPHLNIADLRAYLEYAGAQVIPAADVTAAAQAASELTGPVVVLRHAGRQRPAADAAFAALPNVCQLLFTRGRWRRARIEAPDVVTIDGDALRRQALLRAVAVAAGRASPEIAQDAGEDAFTREEMVPPPTVAEARARGTLILIAEDDDLNQRVILQQLRLLGYAGEVATNGNEALRLWREGRYGLLLTDLHMPEMDGYTLAQIIRREEYGQRHMPIIALTANALRGEANRARAVGMDEYLTKPVPLQQLRTTLEKWLPRDIDAATSAPAPAAAEDDVASLVDTAVLKELVGDDPATVHDFLADYLGSARRLAGEMAAAAATGDLRLVGTLAHKLKSSSRSVGALALGDLCAGLENAGKGGGTATIAQEMQEFKAAMAAVEEEIRELLAGG